MPETALTPALAGSLAGIALGHVTREYPHLLSLGLDGPADLGTPRALHPIFYGSFDWHSCVHGYWLLARVLRRFPGGAQADAIRALFDTQITEANGAAEAAYFARPRARGFERPYGWAWTLKLAAELHGTPWATHLVPLTGTIVQRFRDFLPKATYPVRVGTHFNTAFALVLAADYADGAGDAALADLLRQTARRWYADDRDCQAWEPGGDDFLSPALIEAEAMRRLLPAAEFLPWFDAFLPRLAERAPRTLFRPAIPSDRSDGKIAHLDGLNLSRAWCQRRLAAALPADDPRRPVLLAAAETHLAAGMPHMVGDYMGEHWLATFALLALEA